MNLLKVSIKTYANISISGSGSHKYAKIAVTTDVMPSDATFIAVQVVDWFSSNLPFNAIFSQSERNLYIISTSGIDGTIGTVTVQFVYM